MKITQRFFIILNIVTSFSTNSYIFCMDKPTTPPQVTPISFFNTPIKTKINVTNYCKQLLMGVQNQNNNKIAQALHSFFLKNSYDIKNINGYNKSFYNALSVVLCRCIEQCAYAPDRKTYSYTVITDEDVIYLPLQYNDHIYVFQFFVSKNNERPTFYRYEKRTNITIISINMILDQENDKLTNIKIRKLENNGTYSIQKIKPLHINDSINNHPYNENHFYKKTISRINNTELLNLMLFDLFTPIPQEWLVPREKFFQALWANALTFIGAGLTRTEVTTNRGRADVVLNQHRGLPIIFEFKLGHSAQSGLDQIKDREYPSITDTDAEMVGININLKGCFDITSCYEHFTQPQITLPDITPEARKTLSPRKNTNKSLYKKLFF